MQGRKDRCQPPVLGVFRSAVQHVRRMGRTYEDERTPGRCRDCLIPASRFRPVFRPRLNATFLLGWLCSLGPARPPLHNFANVAAISGTACRPSMHALFRGSAGCCMRCMLVLRVPKETICAREEHADMPRALRLSCART